jgi:hypothetical protein
VVRQATWLISGGTLEARCVKMVGSKPRPSLTPFACFCSDADLSGSRVTRAIWVGGSSSNLASRYNTRGVYSATSTPGGRYDACAVVDPASGNVLMYGGYDGTSAYFGETFSWNGAAFAWLAGSTSTNQLPVYGSKGASMSASGVGMGGRISPSCWYANGLMYVGFGSTSTVIRRNGAWRSETVWDERRRER